MPMTSYTLAASRHMAQYGTTSEQLAQIAVDTRRWAALNPRARYRDPLTVDEVLASPVLASPLHQLDCCLVTDGAGAYVMTSAERARDLARPPVYVLGAATGLDHWVISQMPDLTVTPGAISGPAAFAHAGIGPDDVDVLEALRLVHHHRAAAPRGPRLLRQGRRRRVRRGRQARARAARCR